MSHITKTKSVLKFQSLTLAYMQLVVITSNHNFNLTWDFIPISVQKNKLFGGAGRAAWHSKLLVMLEGIARGEASIQKNKQGEENMYGKGRPVMVGYMAKGKQLYSKNKPDMSTFFGANYTLNACRDICFWQQSSSKWQNTDNLTKFWGVY